MKAELQAQKLKEAEDREKQQEEDRKLAQKLESEKRRAEAEARIIWSQQETQRKAEEVEKARLKKEDEARLQEEVELRLKEERKKYQSETQSEKSPSGSSRAHYYEETHLKPEAANRKTYESSPRSSGSFYAIPNTSRPRPRGEEQPRYETRYPKTSRGREKDYVYIHHDEDEAYHSATGLHDHDEYLRPGMRSRGSSNASGGEGRSREEQLWRENETGTYYDDRRSEKRERGRERGGREKDVGYEGNENFQSGKGQAGW